MRTDDDQRVFAVVPTHTTRHLACCLASLLTQTRPPDAVCLTVDNTEPEILELARRVWTLASPPCPLIVTMRPHRDVVSLNQVRNNALRALDLHIGLRDEDLVLVVDGDTALHPAAVEIHAKHAAGVSTAHRFDLTEVRTADLTEHAVRQGALADIDAWTSPEQREHLAQRARRHQRQLAVRSTPLARSFQKSHKPKLLGGHHAVLAGLLRAINGYDEAFVGYGYDDDDLAARLNRLRPLPAWNVLTLEAVAYHLWHPTRAPERPTAAAGYALFNQRRPAQAELGWATPDEQDPSRIEVIGENSVG